jgi:hypothetical protein
MQMRRTWCGAVGVALLVGLASTPARAVDSGDFTPTGRLLQRWVATNGAADQTMTQTRAEDIARRTEVVVGREKVFGPYLAAMRAVNPGVKVLVYLNGAFSGRDRTFPESYYAHDSSSARLYSTQWQKWMMDVGNRAWSDAVSKECADDIVVSMYDGCYIDMLGVAPLQDGYVSSQPINPATGAAWTPDAYVSATSAIGAAAERANSGFIVVGNGLANGKKYFTSPGATAALLNGLDGANAEGWMRGAEQPVAQFRPEVTWKKDVDMLGHAGAQGKTVLAMTKLWVTATQAQIDRWHKYALASFLLGTDGNAYFSFYANPAGQNMAEAGTPHRFDSVDVGSPVRAYAKTGGLYRRDFSRGIALVNPTTKTVTAQLGGTYTDLDGVRRTAVTLGPNTAEVLTRV